jgi:hypothetical protein
MATQYMYNSMGVGRRGRLTKEEMDKIQHNICTNSIQDSRKNTGAKTDQVQHGNKNKQTTTSTFELIILNYRLTIRYINTLIFGLLVYVQWHLHCWMCYGSDPFYSLKSLAHCLRPTCAVSVSSSCNEQANISMV